MANRKRTVQPHGKLRNPTSDNQIVGQNIDPPMYPQFGGSKEVSDALVRRNDLNVIHTERG